MGYKYNTLHNTVMYDGKDDDRIIEDGERLRVPLMMMDSMQRSIAGTVATVDDDVKLISRQELRDWYDAEVSARWRGGLQPGDRVRIGDKNLVVSGRNPTNGKIQLRDASTSTAGAEARQNMYDEYDRDIQSRYLTTHDAKTGESCSTAGREAGVWREKNGRLVCVPGGKPDQFELGGPLSDADMVQVRDRMYADYDSEVSERWRR